MISVDGMTPEDVTAADAHGGEVAQPPAIHEGGRVRGRSDGCDAYGDLPEPHHPGDRSLPATHGIWANTTLIRLKGIIDGWYWYAEDIRVPTLWDAAATGGPNDRESPLAGHRGREDHLEHPRDVASRTPEDAKLLRAVATRGLMDEAGRELGEYRGGIDTCAEGDEVRGKYAIWILEKKAPRGC